MVDCLLSICKVLNLNTSAMQKGKQPPPPQKKTTPKQKTKYRKPKNRTLVARRADWIVTILTILNVCGQKAFGLINHALSFFCLFVSETGPYCIVLTDWDLAYVDHVVF